MKEITYYVADDGTKFEDYDECYDHELNLKRKKYQHEVRMWDQSLNRTTALDEAYYIKVTSIEGAQWIRDYGKDIGVTTPFDTNPPRCGFWFFNEKNYGTWETWEDISAWYNKVRENCGVE